MPKSDIFWAEPSSGTGTKSWYQYPLCRGEMVPVPIVSGTGTHLQNNIGTGTNQSGSSIDPPATLFLYSFALLSPGFIHR